MLALLGAPNKCNVMADYVHFPSFQLDSGLLLNNDDTTESLEKKEGIMQEFCVQSNEKLSPFCIQFYFYLWLFVAGTSLFQLLVSQLGRYTTDL